MVLTLPVTGRSKADGNHIPEHRTNRQELYSSIVGNDDASIPVRRDHSQVMGQPPQSRHAEPAVNNIDDTDTSAILSAYNTAKGSTDSLTLPSQLFVGADATLKT